MWEKSQKSYSSLLKKIHKYLYLSEKKIDNNLIITRPVTYWEWQPERNQTLDDKGDEEKS